MAPAESTTLPVVGAVLEALTLEFRVLDTKVAAGGGAGDVGELTVVILFDDLVHQARELYWGATWGRSSEV